MPPPTNRPRKLSDAKWRCESHLSGRRPRATPPPYQPAAGTKDEFTWSMTIRIRVVLGVLICSLAIGITVSPGHAFKIRTFGSVGCHEAISMEAVQRAGAPWGQPPPPLSEEERRILDDLPLDNGVTDPWLLGLLIGNRSPDIESGTDTDPSQFAVLHSDPATQQEHCLRRANDDGTEGDRAAHDAIEALTPPPRTAPPRPPPGHLRAAAATRPPAPRPVPGPGLARRPSPAARCRRA